MLKTQRNYGDKCGLGFKKKITKGERKRERKMKKLQQRKLSHTMCYQCHEAGHLANGCPNIEKLKKMKEEERLKHVKCFKCHTWGHLTSKYPTKQLVKQLEEESPPSHIYLIVIIRLCERAILVRLHRVALGDRVASRWCLLLLEVATS